MAWEPRIGEVVPYSFLWAHESALGEESGRKLRPCVIVVAVRRIGADALRVAVAPITTQNFRGRELVELPPAVKRQLGLDDRQSWVVCDEINQFEWPGFDLGLTPAKTNSFGFLPPALLKKVRASIGIAQRRGGLLSTNRDE